MTIKISVIHQLLKSETTPATARNLYRRLRTLPELSMEKEIGEIPDHEPDLIGNDSGTIREQIGNKAGTKRGQIGNKSGNDSGTN